MSDVKGDAREAYGRTWSQANVDTTGGTAGVLVAADATRGGLRVFPHATEDVYIHIAGEDASGSVASGDDLLAAGSTSPLEYLGADCPTGAVSIYTANGVTVIYQTRSGARG